MNGLESFASGEFNLNCCLDKAMAMSFGLNKCNTLHIKRVNVAVGKREELLKTSPKDKHAHLAFEIIRLYFRHDVVRISISLGSLGLVLWQITTIARFTTKSTALLLVCSSLSRA